LKETQLRIKVTLVAQATWLVQEQYVTSLAKNCDCVVTISCRQWAWM